MSNYIVDSADLTSVANAIRTKGGTSAQLAFPADFVSAIEDIETGGGGDYVAGDWLDLTKPTGAVVYNGTSLPANAFYGRTGITSVDIPNAVGGAGSVFYGCTGLLSINAPLLKSGDSIFRGCTNLRKLHIPSYTSTFEYGAYGCSKLEAVYFKTTTTNNSRCLTQAFRNCPKLKVVDLGTSPSLAGGNVFVNDTILDTLILRRTSIQAYIAPNCFTGTPFASGGAGGTIYIPKVLYDQLGTGTNDYKAATNWSTIDGWGTITWAPIEGSYWETHYGDGTPIPTT